MTQNIASLSKVQSLILQWRALALMAVAMGRQMSLLNKVDPRGALQIAELLEVWLSFALFTLVGELAAMQADDDDHWQHSDEVQYLRQITAALAALAMLTAKIKRQLLKRLGGNWRGVNWGNVVDAPLGRLPTYELAYLDSS